MALSTFLKRLVASKSVVFFPELADSKWMITRRKTSTALRRFSSFRNLKYRGERNWFCVAVDRASLSMFNLSQVIICDHVRKTTSFQTFHLATEQSSLHDDRSVQ